MYKKIEKLIITVLLSATLCVVMACKSGNVNDDVNVSEDAKVSDGTSISDDDCISEDTNVDDDNKVIDNSSESGNSLPWIDIHSSGN